MYAILEISGKQHRVEEGQTLEIDRLPQKEKEKIEIDKVLMLVNDQEISVGQPYLSDVKVEAEVIEHFKGEKIRVARFKAKVRYHRVLGFRPLQTKIKILKIIKKSPRKQVLPKKAK